MVSSLRRRTSAALRGLIPADCLRSETPPSSMHGCPTGRAHREQQRCSRVRDLDPERNGSHRAVAANWDHAEATTAPRNSRASTGTRSKGRDSTIIQPPGLEPTAMLRRKDSFVNRIACLAGEVAAPVIAEDKKTSKCLYKNAPVRNPRSLRPARPSGLEPREDGLAAVLSPAPLTPPTCPIAMSCRS